MLENDGWVVIRVWESEIKKILLLLLIWLNESIEKGKNIVAEKE